MSSPDQDRVPDRRLPLVWTTRDRVLQGIVFVSRVVGVPSIAAGLSYERIPLLSVGVWTLFVGVSVGAIDNASVLWKNRRTMFERTTA